jgi:peptide-methionine (S)-S-oxide reductase
MMKATSKQEFSSLSEMPDNAQKATVAAGCFWGVEHLFRKRFGDGKGLLDAKVGYSGGGTKSPSYSNVCSGGTGRMMPLFSSRLPSFLEMD